MAVLPTEVLLIVANHLSDASLAYCTIVCRQWKEIFESLIYSQVHVYSIDNFTEKGMSLNYFRRVTSGPGIGRRAFIRQLLYYIVVPVNLPDWHAVKKRDYSINNAIRDQNDAAFQQDMISLFDYLASWDQTLRLTVELFLRGQYTGTEPLTDCGWEGVAGYYRWDFKKGKTKAVPVYRAKLKNDGFLPNVSCIDRLVSGFSRSYLDQVSMKSFNLDHRIWAGAALQIAQHCSTITKLHLDFDEYIRPDHLEYKQARRQAIADGLNTLPGTLRELTLIIENEEPWEQMMPGLNVLSSNIDTLSNNLGTLSLTLRKLKLEFVSLAPDFLYPLNENSNPLLSSGSLHWPFLETLYIRVSERLPSGQWLVNPTPENQVDIDEVEDWEEILCDTEMGNISRTIFECEHFHRVLISLGYAAHKMSRLVSMQYHFESLTYFDFSFVTKVEGAQWHLEWDGDSLYQPDQRVATAWNFHPTELELPKDFSYPRLTVNFSRWSD